MGGLSKEQRDFLAAHRRISGVQARFKFNPTRSGRPDALLRSLARRGLICIERQSVAHWLSLTGWRGDRENVSWFFGLTDKGQSAAANHALTQKIGE